MKRRTVEIMGGSSEVVHYERQGLPLYVETAELSQFAGKRAACHWHDDLEWIHILDGAMNYSVNGREISLKTGDSLMVNGRQMHYGWGVENCRFICILFHPCARWRGIRSWNTCILTEMKRKAERRGTC